MSGNFKMTIEFKEKFGGFRASAIEGWGGE